MIPGSAEGKALLKLNNEVWGQGGQCCVNDRVCWCVKWDTTRAGLFEWPIAADRA